MKIYQKEFDYDYSFPTVTLAYFLRYPNPYAKHVLSTDVIDRHVDPATQRLHTLRLHLKKSKVPAGILKFLPGGMAGSNGSSQSYIVEKSIVDVKEGWMQTESRNMEWTGVLSVVEKQSFKDQSSSKMLSLSGKEAWTTCKTTVTFVSKLGQAKLLSRRKTDTPTTPTEEEMEAPKQGFFASWSTAGIQRTIELIGVKRTKTAVVNGSEGMKIVLERLRHGGVREVLEGMRQDRMDMMTAEGEWKQVWHQGQHGDLPKHDCDDPK